MTVTGQSLDSVAHPVLVITVIVKILFSINPVTYKKTTKEYHSVSSAEMIIWRSLIRVPAQLLIDIITQVHVTTKFGV